MGALERIKEHGKNETTYQVGGMIVVRMKEEQSACREVTSGALLTLGHQFLEHSCLHCVLGQY